MSFYTEESCSIFYKRKLYLSKFEKKIFLSTTNTEKYQYRLWSNKNWILDPPLFSWQPGDELVVDGLYRDLLTTTFQYEHVSLRKRCIW